MINQPPPYLTSDPAKDALDAMNEAHQRAEAALQDAHEQMQALRGHLAALQAAARKV